MISSTFTTSALWQLSELHNSDSCHTTISYYSSIVLCTVISWIVAHPLFWIKLLQKLLYSHLFTCSTWGYVKKKKRTSEAVLSSGGTNVPISCMLHLLYLDVGGDRWGFCQLVQNSTPWHKNTPSIPYQPPSHPPSEPSDLPLPLAVSAKQHNEFVLYMCTNLWKCALSKQKSPLGPMCRTRFWWPISTGSPRCIRSGIHW